MIGTVKADCSVKLIPIYRINASTVKPQRVYSRKDLNALRKSIEKNGIIQPLTVRDVSKNEYELISGERRLRAAVMQGLTRVPCIILHCNRCQSAVYSIVENLQRESVSIFDRADSIDILINKLGLPPEQAAVQLGIPQSKIIDHLKILVYDKEERILIDQYETSLYCIASIACEEDYEKRHKILINYLNSLELSSMKKSNFDEFLKDKTGFNKIIIKDMRLFSNTIEKAVAAMNNSGITVTLNKRNEVKYIEYKIKIPKDPYLNNNQ